LKIKYSNTRLFSSLLLGSLFSIWGGLKFFEEAASYFNYFQMILGLMMVGNFFFARHYQYLQIVNGLLTKNSFRRKSIQLKNVCQIQSFPGKIKLFTSEEHLNINTELIEDHSRNELLKVLGSLEIENNPFIGYSPKTD